MDKETFKNSPAYKELQTSMKQVSKRIAKSLEPFHAAAETLRKAFARWEAHNQKEFDKTLERVKSYLKGKNLILPSNWREVFLDWWIDQLSEEQLIRQSFNFPVNDPSILIEWSKAYSEQMDAKYFAKPKKAPKPPKRDDLKALFEAEGKAARWDEICHTLSRQGVFDSQSKTWLKPANQLAGTIRVIETRELSLSKKLSIPEIVAIAKKNFGKVINTENVRGETAEIWNWIDLGN